MSHRHGLAGGTCRFPCWAAHLSGCGVGCRRGLMGLSNADLTPHPGMRLLDRPARTVVTGLRLLEEVQYVLRAIGRPHRKKAVIGVL
jgi:hypothetical protein